MDKPKVSVLVPVYNVENYLRACLDSILAQTYQSWECVLVDDGSRDGSGAICDEYAKKDSRFVVIHKQNEGVTKARIDAFEHSKGEYVSFIDADDFVDKCYLDVLLATIFEYHVDMVVCQYWIYQRGESRSIKRNVKGYYDKQAIRRMLQTQFLYDRATRGAGIPIALWAKCVHRKYVLEALKIGEGLKWSEDQLGLFHLLLHIDSFYAVEDCLYYYVMREGQVTKSYTLEFWPHQMEAYRRYRQLDVDNLLRDQLHWRTWLFTIKAGLYKRMSVAIRDYSAFRNEMKRIDKIPSWKDFFSRFSTGLGWRNDIQFWLLKEKCYYIFYVLYYSKKLK